MTSLLQRLGKYVDRTIISTLRSIARAIFAYPDRSLIRLA
jgi:hypothetical protein